MPQPSLLGLPLWDRFENSVLDMMALALSYLEQDPALPLDENSLNQRLSVFCIRAEHQLAREGREPFSHITWESKNQPRPEDPDGAGYLEKRPDFQCSLRDYSVEDWKECAIDYHIECKRLGWPTRSRWVLNQNYIENGVNRFIDPAWRYGRGAQSAAMVGYMQTMTPDDILGEVNTHGTRRGLPAIVRSGPAWEGRGVTRLDPQLLERSFGHSPIRLNHLWLDLRHRTPDEPPGAGDEGTQTTEGPR